MNRLSVTSQKLSTPIAKVPPMFKTSLSHLSNVAQSSNTLGRLRLQNVWGLSGGLLYLRPGLTNRYISGVTGSDNYVDINSARQGRHELPGQRFLSTTAHPQVLFDYHLISHSNDMTAHYRIPAIPLKANVPDTRIPILGFGTGTAWYVSHIPSTLHISLSFRSEPPAAKAASDTPH